MTCAFILVVLTICIELVCLSQADISVSASHAHSLVNISWAIPASVSQWNSIIAIYGGSQSQASEIPVCNSKPYFEDPEGPFSTLNASATITLDDGTTWWYLATGQQENPDLAISTQGWELVRIPEVSNFSACLFVNYSCQPLECQVFNVTQPPYDFIEIESYHTGLPVLIRFNFWSFEALPNDWLDVIRFEDYQNMNESQMNAMVWSTNNDEQCWFYISAAIDEYLWGDAGFFSCPGSAGEDGTAYGWSTVNWGTIKLFMKQKGPFSVGIFPESGSGAVMWGHSYICGMNVSQWHLTEDTSDALDTQSYLYYEITPWLDRAECHHDFGINGIPFEISSLPMRTLYIDTPVDMIFVSETVSQTNESTILKVKVPVMGAYVLVLRYEDSGMELGRYNVTVQAGDIDPQSCSKLSSPSSAVEVHTAHNFTFQAQDFYRNKILEGGHAFVLTLLMPTDDGSHHHGYLYIDDHLNGLYTVSYTLVHEGLHYLEVTCDGVHLSGSPFQIYAYDHTAPLCSTQDLEASVTSCHKNKRTASFRWIEDTVCEGGLELPDDVALPCDHIEPDNAFGITIIVISVLGAVFNSFWIGWIQFYKHKKIVKFAQPLLCKLFAVGCVTVCLTNIFTLGYHYDAMCLARPWVFHLPVTFTFSCLFAKVYRVHRIFGNKKLKKMKIENKVLLQCVFAFCCFEAMVLLLRSLLDAPKAVGHVKYGPYLAEYYDYSCMSETSIFQTLTWAFKLSLLTYGCYLAFVTHDHERHLAEGHFIALAIYNMAILSIVAGLMVLLNVNIQAVLIVETIAVVAGTCFATTMLFVPKLMVILRNGDLGDDPTGSKSLDQTQSVKKRFSVADAVLNGAPGNTVPGLHEISVRKSTPSDEFSLPASKTKVFPEASANFSDVVARGQTNYHKILQVSSSGDDSVEETKSP